jgi:hypothetical protein
MSQRPLPHAPGEVWNKAAPAPAARRTREPAATRDGLAYLVCALIAGALLATTARRSGRTGRRATSSGTR